MKVYIKGPADALDLFSGVPYRGYTIGVKFKRRSFIMYFKRSNLLMRLVGWFYGNNRRAKP